MTDLNVLIRRMNQQRANQGSLEDAATALLVGLLALVALASLL